MTGTLLRTGKLREFSPLGAVGNPVYLSASQLRSALRRRLGSQIADILAIPQRNEDGDTIDWYAPLSGPVVPWSAASPAERGRAKKQLLQIRKQIRETGEAMREDENGERQIFGQLLGLVTTFPNDSHVYLVNDRPVITFWGFQEMNAPPNSDPLLLLPEADERAASTPATSASGSEAEAPRGRRFPWWWLLALLLLLLLLLVALKMCSEDKVAQPASESPVSEPLPAQPSAEKHRTATEEKPVEPPLKPPPDVELRHVIEQVRKVHVVQDASNIDQVLEEQVTGTIGPAQVVEGEASDAVLEKRGVEGVDIAPWDEMPSTASTPKTEKTGPEENSAKAVPDASFKEQQQPNQAQDIEAGKAPQQNIQNENILEDGSRQPPEIESRDTEPDMQASRPDQQIPADPQQKPQGPLLQIPKQALQTGSIEFLDGRWSSSTSLMDSQSGRPIELEYSFQGGTGTVSLKRDGVTCKGKTAAAIENGQLVISDTGNITCPDGARYQGARVKCRVNDQGQADCTGGYPSGDSFATKIRKSE